MTPPANSLALARTSLFRSFIRKTKDGFLYSVVHLGLVLIRALPFEPATRFAESLSLAIYRVMPSLRALSDAHLQIAFANLSAEERQRIARDSMLNIARILVEIAKFDDIRPRLDDYVVVGLEHVDKLRGRPAIVVTAHLGNWELLAAYFGLHGLDIAAVARRFYVHSITQIMVDFRASNGVETILRDVTQNSARQLLGIQRAVSWPWSSTRHPAQSPVPFFGEPARTPVAPVALALRRNIPVCSVFIRRLPSGRHRITIDPPMQLERTGDDLQDIRLGVEAVNRRLEQEILACPEQWIWWHERWRRGPVPQLDLDTEFQYTKHLSTSHAEAAEGRTPDARGRSVHT
jgi:KDO2-lipid IV(A) lauroyltransferase